MCTHIIYYTWQMKFGIKYFISRDIYNFILFQLNNTVDSHYLKFALISSITTYLEVKIWFIFNMEQVTKYCGKQIKSNFSSFPQYL